jgi:hypothetical protein
MKPTLETGCTFRPTFRIRKLASPDMPCENVLVRSGQDAVVVNLTIKSPEPENESREGISISPSSLRFELNLERDHEMSSEARVGELSSPQHDARKILLCVHVQRVRSTTMSDYVPRFLFTP